MTSAANPTATHRLIDRILDGTLDALVADMRSAGSSWDDIAGDLSAKTGVTVSREALRRWYRDAEAVA